MTTKRSPNDFPAAVVFDFDGVIADTERMHFDAFNRALAAQALPPFSWEDYVATYIGFDDRGVAAEVFRRAGLRDPARARRLAADKAAAFQELIAAGVAPFPGVRELLAALRGRFPLALCSGALRADIRPILAATRLADAFEEMVTADDVPAAKPDPAGYRLALRRLEARHVRPLPPEQCLAIEDTLAGVAAAHGAGLRVLVVTNSHPAAHFPPHVRAITETLAGWTPERLTRLA